MKEQYLIFSVFVQYPLDTDEVISMSQKVGG